MQKEVKLIAATPGRRVHTGDILMIEAEAKSLTDVLSILGLKLEALDKSKVSEKSEPGAGDHRGCHFAANVADRLAAVTLHPARDPMTTGEFRKQSDFSMARSFVLCDRKECLVP